MGLESVEREKALYLSIAGGFIWDRKAEKTHPNYATQEYTMSDGSTKERAGARFKKLTGKVSSVEFRTHKQYGENVNVKITDGGDNYILSISTNNRYSQDMMKALLAMDLKEEIEIKPYDFIGSDKKRARGISFTQCGEKLQLRNDNAPSQDSEWFKSAPKKNIKRFFEDLNDWYVAEVEEKVCPLLDSTDSTTSEKVTKEKPKEKVEKKEAVVVSTIKMKKFVKEYISENYEDEVMPKLTKEELKVWYDLAVAEDDLPFPEEEDSSSDADLDEQLEALM